MRFGSHRRVRSSQVSSNEAASKDAPSLGGSGVVAPPNSETSSSVTSSQRAVQGEFKGRAKSGANGMSLLRRSLAPWTGLSAQLSKFLGKLFAPFMGVECREAHQAQAPQAAGSAQSRQPLNRRARILARVRSVLLTALWFMPGAFFIAIGLSVAFAPQLLMSAVAGFCVFFGFASFGLAWKFIQLKNRVEKVAQSFETRIMVQAIPHGKLADPEERVQDLGTVQTKKILFH